MFSVELKKESPKRLLGKYKRSRFLRFRFKFFIQTNGLYLKNTDDEIILSLVVKYSVSRNEFNDKILMVELVKSGSSIDDDLENYGGNLQSLLGCEVMKFINDIDSVKYEFLLLENETETYDMNETLEPRGDGKVRLNKYYDWDYSKNGGHCLIFGNSGSGKTAFSLYLLRQLQAETDYLIVCDCKFDELKNKALEYGVDSKYVAKDLEHLFLLVQYVNDTMEKLYSKNKKIIKPMFLIIDEYASARLGMDNKKFKTFEGNVKNLALKARGANIHLVLITQRVGGKTLDLDIRDQLGLRLGFHNLSSENFEMGFGVRKDNMIVNRKVGEGYIRLEGQELGLFRAPYLLNL